MTLRIRKRRFQIQVQILVFPKSSPLVHCPPIVHCALAVSVCGGVAEQGLWGQHVSMEGINDPGDCVRGIDLLIEMAALVYMVRVRVG